MGLDRAIRLCLYGVLIAVPLVFDPHLHRVFILEKTALLCVLVSAAALLWTVRSWQGRGTPGEPTRLNGPILATVASASVATAFSTSPRISILGSFVRQEGLVLILTHVLLFYLTFRFLRDRPRPVAILVAAATAIASGYGIVQRTGYDPVLWGEPVWFRVTSTFGQPNALGGYLAMSLPIILGLAVTVPEERALRHSRHGRWRSFVQEGLCWVCFAVSAACLLLTGSRGSWMGAAAGIGVLVVVSWRRTRFRRTIIRAGVFLIVLAGLFCLHPGLSPLNRIRDTVRVQNGAALDGTARLRWVTWRASLGIIRDHPATGVGPEMMREFFPRYLRAEDPETEADRAHSFLLDEAVAKGLPGCLSLTWFLVALLVGGWRDLRWEEGQEAGPGSDGIPMKMGFLSGISAYLVQNLVGFGWPATASLFWVLAGMVAVPLSHRTTGPTVFWEKVWSPLRSFLRVAQRAIRYPAGRPFLLAAMALTANIALAVAAVLADRTFARGLELKRRGETEEAIGQVREAMRRFPGEAAFAAELGGLLRLAGEQAGDDARLAEAERVIRKAVEVGPEDGHMWANLATVRAARFRLTGRDWFGQLATRDYEEALRRLPKSAGIAINHANLLMAQGLGEAAARVCEAGTVRNPASADLQMALGRVHQARENWVAAVSAYTRAAALEPARAEAHRALGRVAFERGDFEEASAAFREASRLRPGSAAMLDDLGTALYRAGRFGEASEAFREALRILPGDPYAREVLEAALAEGGGRSPGKVAPEQEAPGLPKGGEITFFAPSFRRYLGEGWSYTETWGTWATGTESEIFFSLAKGGPGALVLRATAASLPGRSQSLTVFLNDIRVGSWSFTRPLWVWETFRTLLPPDAMRPGVNRLALRFAFCASPGAGDLRPVAAAFERIMIQAH